MNRVRLAVSGAVIVVVVVIAGSIGFALSHHAPGVATASVTSPSKVVFSDVTVTAANVNRESAVAMSIHNKTGGPISLMTVSSPVSGMEMLYYDTNMCQGNSAMTWLPNILISSNQTQLLGYKNQGVMLSLLHQRLEVGQSVPLRVTYSDFSTSRVVTVEARVVAPPRGLHFVMSSMKM